MAVLAGDAGGTKTILALVEGEELDFKVVAEKQYASAEFPGRTPIVRRFLNAHGATAEAACFGVPGAVRDGECRTPNLPWFLSETDLAATTDIPRVQLVNDFVVAAADPTGLTRDQTNDAARAAVDAAARAAQVISGCIEPISAHTATARIRGG